MISAFDKSFYDWPEASMNDDLSQDQHRQRDEKPHLGLDIMEKGELSSAK